MEEQQLVDWLNKKGNGKLKAIEDAKTGREICFFLVLLTGKPDYHKRIGIGKTTSECSANFQLAKLMFFHELNRPFNYTIAKLVDGNREELIRLLKELQSLDVQSVDDVDIPIDHFITELETDLENQWKNCIEFRDNLDKISKERDFYFNKLQTILELTRNYKKEDVETVFQIITAYPNDLLPSKKKE